MNPSSSNSPVPFPIPSFHNLANQQQQQQQQSQQQPIVLHAFLGRRYIITKTIGQGAFGLAMVARMPYHHNQLVVVKRLKYLAPGFSPRENSNRNDDDTAFATSPLVPNKNYTTTSTKTTAVVEGQQHRDDASSSTFSSSSSSFSSSSSSSSSSSLPFSAETQIKVNEVQALAALSHPNIVQFFEAWFDKSDGHLYFSMEYCPGRDLEYFIKKRNSTDSTITKNNNHNSNNSAAAWPLPESWIVCWLHQILSALYYMHVHRVVHRDIKLQNIFVVFPPDGESTNADNVSDDPAYDDDDAKKTKSNPHSHENDRHRHQHPHDHHRHHPPTLKIGDFGLSRFLASSNDNAASTSGSPFYFSYEIASGIPHNFKTDVFSAGVVFYILMTGTFPFTGSSLLAVLHSIRHHQPTFASPITSIYSEDLRRVVLAMMTKEPAKRPSAGSLLHFLTSRASISRYLSPRIGETIERRESNEKAELLRKRDNFTPIPPLKNRSLQQQQQQQQERIRRNNVEDKPSNFGFLAPFRMMLLKFQIPVPQQQQQQQLLRVQHQPIVTLQTLTVNLRSAPSIRSTCVGKLTWGDVILVVEVLKSAGRSERIKISDRTEESDGGNEDDDEDEEEGESENEDNDESDDTEDEDDDDDDDECSNDPSGGGVWYRITEPIPSYCIATLQGKQLFGRIVVDDHLTQLANSRFSPAPGHVTRRDNHNSKNKNNNNRKNSQAEVKLHPTTSSSSHAISSLSHRLQHEHARVSKKIVVPTTDAAIMRTILSQSPVAEEVNGI